MTLKRKLEKAANNQDVLNVITELIERSETSENAIDKLEKKVEELEKAAPLETSEKDDKPGFFSLGSE